LFCWGNWNIVNVPHLASASRHSSSPIGTTACCGLWPVKQYPSIFFYPSPPFSITSFPALEDLFLLPLSILSWIFPFALSLPVLEWRSFWVSYPPPFFPVALTNLSFALFIHSTISSPLIISSSSQFVLLFHSLFSYLGPYILLNIFLSKIRRSCSSFFVNVHASAPYNTTILISVHQDMVCVNISAIRPQCNHIDSIFKYGASTGQILLLLGRVIISMMVGTEDLKIDVNCEQWVEGLIFVTLPYLWHFNSYLVLFGNYLPHKIA